MPALFASAATVIGYLVDAVKYGPLVIGFIHNSVTAVEATDKSGPDKLTAVLNAVQTLADGILPDEAKEIDAFMTAIEALVNDIVAVYNDAGIFIKKLEPAHS